MNIASNKGKVSNLFFPHAIVRLTLTKYQGNVPQEHYEMMSYTMGRSDENDIHHPNPLYMICTSFPAALVVC